MKLELADLMIQTTPRNVLWRSPLENAGWIWFFIEWETPLCSSDDFHPAAADGQFHKSQYLNEPSQSQPQFQPKNVNSFAYSWLENKKPHLHKLIGNIQIERSNHKSSIAGKWIKLIIKSTHLHTKIKNWENLTERSNPSLMVRTQPISSWRWTGTNQSASTHLHNNLIVSRYDRQRVDSTRQNDRNLTQRSTSAAEIEVNKQLTKTIEDSLNK